jgi:hypothetical protein
VVTVDLTAVWLNLLATDESVSANSRDRAPDYTNTGEIKHLSGGRMRAVTVVGESGVIGFTLTDVTETTVTTLRAWKGQAVRYRDNRGRMFTGVFLQVTPRELADGHGFANKLSDVALSVRFVDAPTGV